MGFSAEICNYQSEKVIRLTAGPYTAVIAPFLGSNILYMKNSSLGIDFFRHVDSLSTAELQQSPEVYGFPTLLYPNRLKGGILKTSDAEYHFPVNETAFGNHIHGFLHKRTHDIVSAETEGETAVAKTRYVYDEKDPFFQYFPVSLQADFTFTLGLDGMHYAFTVTNRSKDRNLPYGVANHCTFNGPFEEGADPLDTRLYLPIGDKWPLDASLNPTSETVDLDHHDKQYLTGSIIPVKQVIDNDVYNAAVGEVDGKPFHGALISDIRSGKQIVFQVDDAFKFWVVWNDGGEKGYFCPEPMTWMINAPNLPVPAEESGYAELLPGESRTLRNHIYGREAKD